MYKTILVHVDDTDRCAERIALAARLAMEHEAHLVGAAATGFSPTLFANATLSTSMPPIAFPVEAFQADAERALDLFDEQARRLGVPSFERRRIDDEASMGISLHARYADLVVIGQTDLNAPAPRLRPDFPEYVVLNCPRPVLVVPAAGAQGPVGRRITVAWNGSPNAVHAISSAIPLLRRAVAVNLVVFDADASTHGAEPGADIALYLARHGVQVEVSRGHGGGDAGAALLSFAADRQADLIVMGAYGHSRLTEILLGGASRSALLASPIPLWMAH